MINPLGEMMDTNKIKASVVLKLAPLFFLLLSLAGYSVQAQFANYGSSAGCQQAMAGGFTPISCSSAFQSVTAGVQANNIFSAGALSDAGAFLSANLVNLFILGIVAFFAFKLAERFYSK